MRFGGQYVANTGPIRFPRGTAPHDARVAGLSPVVAHHEVLPFPTCQTPVCPPARDGRMYGSGTTFPLMRRRRAVVGDDLVREPDQPLHEDAARVAALLRRGRRVEDDDVAAVRRVQPVAEAAGEHAVGEARLAAAPSALELRAQCSVGSIDDDGIRYGFTTHALIASTIRTAPTIVRIQSIATRQGRGSPRVIRSMGFLTRRFSIGSALSAIPRSCDGRPTGAPPAPANHGTPRAACSEGTQDRRRAPRRSSRRGRTPRCRARPAGGGRSRRSSTIAGSSPPERT